MGTHTADSLDILQDAAAPLESTEVAA